MRVKPPPPDWYVLEDIHNYISFLWARNSKNKINAFIVANYCALCLHFMPHYVTMYGVRDPGVMLIPGYMLDSNSAPNKPIV